MSADDADDIYSNTILERARHPRHQNRLELFDTEVREVNPLCGDRITLRLRRDEQGDIVALGYEARSCAICMASADLMAELVPGMAAVEALRVGQMFGQALRSGETLSLDERMAELRQFAPLHRTPSRIGCATLPWQALEQAVMKEMQRNA